MSPVFPMKNELQERLYADFPLLYKNNDTPMQSCMFWGFEVGDGWFDLLYELSSKLTEEIKKHENRDPDDYCCDFIASQVKEKYGTLRFYMESSTKEMNDLIEQYIEKSETICEVCGKPGKIVGKSWYSVRCVDHE